MKTDLKVEIYESMHPVKDYIKMSRIVIIDDVTTYDKSYRLKRDTGKVFDYYKSFWLMYPSK